MLKRLTLIIALVFVALAASPAWADEYSNTVAIFKNAGESGKFFQTAYGYAVFPTIEGGQRFHHDACPDTIFVRRPALWS